MIQQCSFSRLREKRENMKLPVKLRAREGARKYVKSFGRVFCCWGFYAVGICFGVYYTMISKFQILFQLDLDMDLVGKRNNQKIGQLPLSYGPNCFLFVLVFFSFTTRRSLALSASLWSISICVNCLLT